MDRVCDIGEQVHSTRHGGMVENTSRDPIWHRGWDHDRFGSQRLRFDPFLGSAEPVKLRFLQILATCSEPIRTDQGSSIVRS